MPAVGTFYDPAARTPARAADQRWLPATTNVRDDPALSRFGFANGIVVPFVETEMLWTARPARRPQLDGVERDPDHAHVIDVGRGQRDGNRNAASVAKDVAFAAELAAIGGIGTGEVPPFGALMVALSSEHQDQSMPRS